MDQQFIDQFKARLLDQKNKISGQLEGITHEKSFNRDKVQAKWESIGDKDEDNALEVADFQDSVALERNLEIGLEKVKTALKKIEEGKFGLCEKCGNSIEEERLLAIPEANLCMICLKKKV
ncbi:MAG: TraR/DksA C4-type zinc finger protein [Patescibacteria group bacterium]|jgi:RNA polymerase-binding transcription factor DksA